MTKMLISGAPLYLSHLDKSLMNAVIMQLEVENNGDDTGKGNVKFADHKLMFYEHDLTYVPILKSHETKNRFLDHYRKYFDPYHASVPTPPPNLA